MQKKLISILLIAAMMFCLVGCGGGGGNAADSDSDAGAVLVFATASDPIGLDPAFVDDMESSRVNGNIYEGLLKYSEDSTDPQPCLAESWTVSEDGLSYTFVLKQGVKFHDGTDFNAEAVKVNFDRLLPGNATEDMPYAEFVFGMVSNVEVVDEYTVKVNLTEVCTPFLNNLCMPMAAPIVSPAALEASGGNVTENPVGTGPFKFVEWAKGENVIIERNDAYWGEPAKVQNVIYKIIPDTAARVVALTNGEVDIVADVDINLVGQIEEAGMNVYEVEGMNTSYMAYNTTRAPFDNPEVRQALTMAINVPELVENLYQGYATVADTILPSSIPGYDESIKQVEYNPEKAKEILEKYNVTEVHMITHTVARAYNTLGGQVLAEAIQSYWSQVGLEVTIDASDWGAYKQKMNSGDYDVCFWGWLGDNGDADNFLALLGSDDMTMNVAHYDNPEYKALLAKALTVPNGEERNALYSQAEKIVAEDCPWAKFTHLTVLSAYNPEVQNYKVHPTNNIFFVNMSK
ncbi:MAG: ABC transporter substrate-binding protein [Peptococcaceae bacterium]|nr:ABC transporter substrate-binding protein [Peptococcaceae bacterium]